MTAVGVVTSHTKRTITRTVTYISRMASTKNTIYSTKVVCYCPCQTTIKIIIKRTGDVRTYIARSNTTVTGFNVFIVITSIWLDRSKRGFINKPIPLRTACTKLQMTIPICFSFCSRSRVKTNTPFIRKFSTLMCGC